MHVTSLSIENFKSFLTRTSFSFQPGFNVLLGANSAGKSSVLQAIDVARCAHTPHRSILNLTHADATPPPHSQIEVEATITKDELSRTVVGQHVFVGVGQSQGHFYTTDLATLNEQITTQGLRCAIRLASSGIEGQFHLPNWPGVWRPLGPMCTFPAAVMDPSIGICSQVTNISTGAADVQRMFEKLGRLTHTLSSERQVQATCGHQAGGDLSANASNLAYCVNHLQSNNKNLFETLNHLLRRVFPTVHWVAAPPNGSNQFELRVHTTSPELNRGDLAVPINRVGTGIGNALAMLYVALTAQTPHVLLLEEPNSYLHPRALRELLAILADVGRHHQYFVTTHSADVLRTITPATVTLLEYDGVHTSAKQTSGSTIHALRAGLIDLGIRLTDLHGCDRVLWVEGETEEAVFPMLLRKFAPEKAEGVAIVPLHSTGDFESRKFKPGKVAEIYRRLSQESFLAPPMVGIALDREGRKEAEIESVMAESSGLVSFLPRPMLEDYFLHPKAIASVLHALGESGVTEEMVTEELRAARASVACRLTPKNSRDPQPNAARVLACVFSAVTDSRMEFRKTRDSVALATWLAENDPNELDELSDWLRQLLEQVRTGD